MQSGSSKRGLGAINGAQADPHLAAHSLLRRCVAPGADTHRTVQIDLSGTVGVEVWAQSVVHTIPEWNLTLPRTHYSGNG